MKRNISDLSKHNFDVIVVGGGIHGAATAWQCAVQGMKVALIENNDFGGITSANSLKIIHGGFRYLQHLNIKRMRESIVSRRIMSQISPENVKALRCAIPNSGYGLRSKFLMRIALVLNDLISIDRNRAIPDECRIPRGKVLSLGDCKKLFPTVDWSHKSGGSIWYDALALNSERLTLAFVQEASHKGAIVANYVAAKKIVSEKGQVQGIIAYDAQKDATINIQGKTVVVAAGPENDRLLGKHQNKRDVQKQWAKAVNIIVRKQLLTDTAIGLTGEEGYVDQDAVLKKKGRFFFFVPWRNYTMIGTTYTFTSDSTEAIAEKNDIDEILTEVNNILPQANLSTGDVSYVHVGRVPAYGKEKGNEVQLVKETEITELSSKLINPINGLYSIKSVKYTTAPTVAMETAKKLAGYLGKTYKKLEIFTNLNSHPNLPTAENQSASGKIWKRYGKNSDVVSQYITANDEVICENPTYYAGEIDYFVKEEMAQTLSDVVFRRSDIGTAECPSRETLEKLAEKMAPHFQWNSQRIEAEIAAVEAKFSWK